MQEARAGGLWRGGLLLLRLRLILLGGLGGSGDGCGQGSGGGDGNQEHQTTQTAAASTWTRRPWHGSRVCLCGLYVWGGECRDEAIADQKLAIVFFAFEGAPTRYIPKHKAQRAFNEVVRVPVIAGGSAVCECA